MSRVAEIFVEDVANIVNKYKGVISLPTLIYELNGKWSLINNDQTADLLERLGFGITFVRDRYMIEQ